MNYTSTEGGLDTRVCCPVHLGGLDVGAPSAAMSGALPGGRGDLWVILGWLSSQVMSCVTARKS